MTTDANWFAVAVRDAGNLWLYLEIKRSRKSDVYVFWPYEHKRDHHVSYHRDGRWCSTSYHYKSSGNRQQKPNVTLRGSERVLTTSIHLTNARALNTPCRRARSGDEYTGVFEISADKISAERVKYTTSLAIDLAEPGVLPPVESVIQRVVFTDAVPHIHVALWDPTDLLTKLKQVRAGKENNKRAGTDAGQSARKPRRSPPSMHASPPRSD